jgi:hypothetical protein
MSRLFAGPFLVDPEQRSRPWPPVLHAAWLPLPGGSGPPPRRFIARLESGDQPPSIPTLAKLSAGTGLDFDVKIKNGAVEFVAL